ncbi:MAG TPA: branched-chain amino acid ABC transporter ATP-binding protein/permease, partial [Acidimicrobiales bacterium]|nr:branched-chain amino acid ABC transporter ATP-binding protein/permease [Acidimicrobiales bacterium]
VIALSSVVVTGYAGQISLAQLTLAGVAAFGLTHLQINMGIPFPFAPLLAGLFSMVIGVIVGLPALRVRGLSLALVTIASAVFISDFWFSNTSLNNNGNTTIDGPTLFGWNLAVGSGKTVGRLQFGILCLVVLLLAGIGISWLRRSRLGAAMLAVRANERSAAAVGIDVNRTKLVAFAIGSFVAGIGGCLLAYQQTQAVGESFDPIVGLALFATVYLGGITSISGGMIAGLLASGGLIYTQLTNHLSLGIWYGVLVGILLVVTVIKNPEGLAAGVHALSDRLQATRLATKLAAYAPVTVEAAPTSALARPDISQVRAEEQPAPEQDVILKVDDLVVSYGGTRAVDQVSFEVREGEILGLIGPNGAGKTTLVDALCGFAASSGELWFDGKRLDGLRPHERARLGLGRTFQGLDLYDDLSVLENVVVGRQAAVRREASGHAPTLSEPERLCANIGLGEQVATPAKELSQGQRQLVSVARALAGRPRVLLLDEPAGGLDTNESLWLGERLRRIRDAGVTIVLIDHDMHLVLGLCDRILVLDLGAKIASGTPSEIRHDPEVASAYLGDAHDGTEPGATETDEQEAPAI